MRYYYFQGLVIPVRDPDAESDALIAPSPTFEFAPSLPPTLRWPEDPSSLEEGRANLASADRDLAWARILAPDSESESMPAEEASGLGSQASSPVMVNYESSPEMSMTDSVHLRSTAGSVVSTNSNEADGSKKSCDFAERSSSPTHAVETDGSEDEDPVAKADAQARAEFEATMRARGESIPENYWEDLSYHRLAIDPMFLQTLSAGKCDEDDDEHPDTAAGSSSGKQ